MSRPPSPEQQRQHIAASYRAAMKLDTVGMAVVVTRDNGQLEHTKLATLPWTLGHGLWVACVEGISGGYDCTRIRPAAAAKPGTRLERGGA